MQITLEQFRAMLNEVEQQDGLRVPNSTVIQALNDESLGVRHMAIFLADQRGLQIVIDRAGR